MAEQARAQIRSKFGVQDADAYASHRMRKCPRPMSAYETLGMSPSERFNLRHSYSTGATAFMSGKAQMTNGRKPKPKLVW